MANSEIHLECLVGRRVVDTSGQTIGHIEEIQVERHGDEWAVQAYLLGPYALLERLWPGSLASAIRRVLGLRRPRSVFALPWNKLDLSDPRRPLLIDPADS